MAKAFRGAAAEAGQTRFPFAHQADLLRSDPRLAQATSASRAKRAKSARRLPFQMKLPFGSAAPDLFVHEGARQALERRLGGLLGERMTLSITDNRRTMISSNRRRGFLRLRLHHMFLDANDGLLQALARYLKAGDRHASTALGEYIDQNQDRIRKSLRRRAKLRTNGEHHDLKAIFDGLNARYFGDRVRVDITWGQRSSGRRKRRRTSIRLGTYCAEDNLIRIHPVLDQSWVPKFFLTYIVFHEMLHHVVPAPVSNGRQCYHSARFRARERAYPDYERAIRWENRYVHRLLALA